MQTVSSVMAEGIRNVAGRRQFVVVIDHGGTYYGFSTHAQLMSSGAVPVRPFLIGVKGLTREANIFSKSPAFGDVTVTISNHPIVRSTSSPYEITERMSDILTGIRGDALYVYAVAGERLTNLSNALLLFNGKIVGEPSYNSTTMTIKAVEWSKLIDIELPLNRVCDVFPQAPVENSLLHLPLCYGTWVKDLDNNTDIGLAVGIQIDTIEGYPKVVGSDHAMHAMNSLWAKISNLPEPFEYQTVTATDDDSGYGTVVPTDWGCRVYLYPILNYTGDTGESWTGVPPPPQVADAWTQDIHLAGDKRDDTAAKIYDCWDNGTNNGMIAICAFEDYASGDDLTNEIGRMTAMQIQIMMDEASGFPGWLIGNTPSISLAYGPANADTETLASGIGALTGAFYNNDVPLTGDTKDWQTNIAWHMRSGSDAMAAAGKDYPIIFFVSGVATSGADSVVGNTQFIDIFQARLRIDFDLKKSVVAQSFWVEGEGREYDSWITGRSSNYSSGDCITDPAGIIESLMRGELGLADASFDLPSFIEAENTSVSMRLNLHDENKALFSDIVKQICEQSTFSFVWRPNGQARLIDLTAAPGSVDRTILYSDIDGDIEIGQETFMINELIVESRFLPEDNKYYEVDTYSDATAQSNYGVFTYRAKWPNICGTSKTHVAEHLVDTGAIWSSQHTVLKFRTHGFSNADLELGDWISFQSGPFDAKMKVYGVSVSGKKFLIVSVEYKLDYTEFEVIELY